MRILTIAFLAFAVGAPALAQAEGAKPAAACHARADKTVKCASPKSRKKRAGSDEGLKAQSFSLCRDVRTHTATKCGGPYAEPVPAN